MLLWESLSKVRFLFEQFTSTYSSQEMKRLRGAHGRGQFHDHVNMIRHHPHFSNGDVILFCNVMQNVFAKFFILLPPKHIVPIFWTPFQMVQILTNAIASDNKFQNYMLLDRSLTALAFGECAY